MTNLPLLERAVRLAVRAHDGQMRKESNTPYITHLIGVSLILAKHGFSDTVIAAGLAHDTVEDTTVTPEELREMLGEEVATIIAAATNDDNLPWEEKKKKYIESIRNASESAKAVATADKIHNAESLLAAYSERGTDLWKLFNAGRDKKLWFENAMLSMLQESWNHPLIGEYEVLVEKMNALV